MKINKFGGALLWTITFFVFGSLNIQALSFDVPEPKEMISRSGFVAVGRLFEREGKLYFTFTEVLKGASEAKQFEVADLYRDAVPIHMFVKIVEDNEILFVGDLADGKLLKPSYGFCSVWPYGVSEDYLTQRTLEACKEFAKQVIKDDALSSEGK